MFSDLWFRVRALFRRNSVETELHEELRFHLERQVEKYMEQGLSRGEAQQRTRREFGGIELAKEECRDARGVRFLETLFQDLRFSLRMLRKSPGFTAVAVLTLALAIGANTTIFSAVYSVLLKPLPFMDADRLVFIEKKNPARGWTRNPISPAEIVAWREQSGAFEDVAAYSQNHCVLTGAGEAEEDPCETISSNLFPILGATPIRGRTFSADEEKPEGPRVAILSYGLWQRRFAGEENVIGRAIDIDGASYAVVGVMPSNFSQLYAPPYDALSESGAELWVAGIGLSPVATRNDYFAIGRLKLGVNLQQAAARMNAVSVRIDTVLPELKGWRAQPMSLREMNSGDTRPALLVLMGAVIFVLLIACANIANLLLARGAGRANEFALRNALGAGQGRIFGQLLTESLVVSVAGGVLGVVLAFWGCQALVPLAPAVLLKSVPGLGGVNVQVLCFSLATVMLTTLFFGLAPALQGARPRVSETLKETGRSSLQSPRSRRFRNALVVSEIALAMVLLVGAALMVRTLARLNGVNLGFNSSSILTLRVSLSGERYREPQARVQFWERALSAVASLPNVESASVSRGLPIFGWNGQFFATADDPNPPAGHVPDANYIIVGPDYFRVLQIPMRRGRGFNDQDTQSGDRVAIVNEALTRTYWPGQDPLHKQLRLGGQGPWLSVVGVAENVLSQGPGAGFHAEIYVPYQQYPWLVGGPKHLIVRASATVKPESLAHVVVQEIHRIDKDQPVADITTMEQYASAPLAQERLVMSLLLSFAGLALVLSALGIYSVLSYAIAQRTREIGLRMALGAQHGNVLRLVVGGGVGLALLGIAVGIVAASALTRMMTELLYGVRATDPATFAAVTLILAANSLLACYLPARRALRVDPMVALRHE